LSCQKFWQVKNWYNFLSRLFFMSSCRYIYIGTSFGVQLSRLWHGTIEHILISNFILKCWSLIPKFQYFDPWSQNYFLILNWNIGFYWWPWSYISWSWSHDPDPKFIIPDLTYHATTMLYRRMAKNGGVNTAPSYSLNFAINQSINQSINHSRAITHIFLILHFVLEIY